MGKGLLKINLFLNCLVLSNFVGFMFLPFWIGFKIVAITLTKTVSVTVNHKITIIITSRCVDSQLQGGQPGICA